MRKNAIITLVVVLLLLFCFIYVTASGISQLSNEKVLFLYLDETRGNPGTVEVASLAIFTDAHLQESLIKVNPLSSTEELKNTGVSLSDCLIKAHSVEEGVQTAKTIAESETHTTIDRVVLMDSSALKSIIDKVYPIPVDKAFKITTLDRTFELHAQTEVTGDSALNCIRGKEYPGIDNEELLQLPEDYLWEVKAVIINDVTEKLFDFDQYTPQEQKRLASAAVDQFRKDLITVHERNAVLTMVYYLPGFISRQIVNFAVRRIA